MCITKETKWQLLWLHSVSVKNQISPFETHWNWTEGPVHNTHSYHIVLNPLNKLFGADDACLRQKNEKGQQQNCCPGNGTTAASYISGAKFVKHCSNISRVLIKCLTVLVHGAAVYLLSFLRRVSMTLFPATKEKGFVINTSSHIVVFFFATKMYNSWTHNS